MRITGRTFLVISQSLIILLTLSTLSSRSNNFTGISTLPTENASIEFYAVNDTFYFVTNCASNIFYDNVVKNDVFQNSENAQVCYVFAPEDGVLTFGTSGNFTLTLPNNYSGTLEFRYSLCNKSNRKETSEAKVVIIVKNDNDCDGITNDMDLDNDNDGILDVDEGNGMLDSDSDGLTDNLDIDSDGDGITDNEEWQKEGYYLAPLEYDSNENGWDDAYDIELNGVYYKPVDTDENGVPDFIDMDSDKDDILDCIEGFDNDNDGIADISPMQLDEDRDGLDDAYDLISCWSVGCNSTGSNSPLPDINKNGIRDWREIILPDEPDGYSTQKNEFSVYPNPTTSGNFYVNIPLPEEIRQIELHLFNIHGVEVYRELINPGISKIKVDNIASGNYILKVNSGQEIYQSVISIQ